MTTGPLLALNGGNGAQQQKCPSNCEGPKCGFVTVGRPVRGGALCEVGSPVSIAATHQAPSTSCPEAWLPSSREQRATIPSKWQRCEATISPRYGGCQHPTAAGWRRAHQQPRAQPQPQQGGRSSPSCRCPTGTREPPVPATGGRGSGTLGPGAAGQGRAGPLCPAPPATLVGAAAQCAGSVRTPECSRAWGPLSPIGRRRSPRNTISGTLFC